MLHNVCSAVPVTPKRPCKTSRSETLATTITLACSASLPHSQLKKEEEEKRFIDRSETFFTDSVGGMFFVVLSTPAGAPAVSLSNLTGKGHLYIFASCLLLHKDIFTYAQLMLVKSFGDIFYSFIQPFIFLMP